MLLLLRLGPSLKFHCSNPILSRSLHDLSFKIHELITLSQNIMRLWHGSPPTFNHISVRAFDRCNYRTLLPVLATGIYRLKVKTWHTKIGEIKQPALLIETPTVVQLLFRHQVNTTPLALFYFEAIGSTLIRTN